MDAYPCKLTQQQLLLLNSLSNRLSWLLSDLNTLGVPLQGLQSHFNSLNRMVGASREIQCKLQSFVRKHRRGVSSSQISTPTVDIEEMEKEKAKLAAQVDALNAKIQFFSTECQRITALYVKEKSKSPSDASLTDRLEEYENQLSALFVDFSFV